MHKLRMRLTESELLAWPQAGPVGKLFCLGPSKGPGGHQAKTNKDTVHTQLAFPSNGTQGCLSHIMYHILGPCITF